MTFADVVVIAIVALIIAISYLVYRYTDDDDDEL